MPKKIITKMQARDFIQSQFIMNIATRSKQRPHSSVLLYAMDDDFTFYIVTHSDTYKADNMKAYADVSFSIWSFGTMLIQADATAKEITSIKQKKKIVEKLADAATNNEHFWPPLLRIGGDAYIIFSLTPYWLRALDVSKNTITAKESPFSQIIG